MKKHVNKFKDQVNYLIESICKILKEFDRPVPEDVIFEILTRAIKKDVFTYGACSAIFKYALSEAVITQRICEPFDHKYMISKEGTKE